MKRRAVRHPCPAAKSDERLRVRNLLPEPEDVIHTTRPGWICVAAGAVRDVVRRGACVASLKQNVVAAHRWDATSALHERLADFNVYTLPFLPGLRAGEYPGRRDLSLVSARLGLLCRRHLLHRPSPKRANSPRTPTDSPTASSIAAIRSSTSVSPERLPT
jgi:hypothetical protein